MGTKWGLSLEGPRDSSVAAAAEMSASEPMPEPIATPARVGSYTSRPAKAASAAAAPTGARLAAASASSAAASAKSVNRAIRRGSSSSDASDAAAAPPRAAASASRSKSRMTPPILDDSFASGPESELPTTDASSAEMPLPPATSRDHVAGAERPSGETIPMPVTATRRRPRAAAVAAMVAMTL